MAKRIRHYPPGYVAKQSDLYRFRHPIRCLLNQTRWRAKAKGIEFSITENDLIIPEFCPIFGTKLTVYSGGPRTPDRISIDRKDNSKGYTPDNTRIISWRANQMKGDLTLQDVKNLLRYMEN